MRTIYMNEIHSTHDVGNKWEIQLLKGTKEARITGKRGHGFYGWENPIQCHVTLDKNRLFLQGEDVPAHVLRKASTLIRKYL